MGVVRTQPNPLTNEIGNGGVTVLTSPRQQDNEHFIKTKNYEETNCSHEYDP